MLTVNDGVQYVLIAALFVAAFADSRAHRSYAKTLSALFSSVMAAQARIETAQARIEAKLDCKDHP